MKSLKLVLTQFFRPSAFSADNAVRINRPVGLFHIATGGCGACGQEVQALRGSAYGLAQWGIEFVNTPQAADYLLLTGALGRNMGYAVDAAWYAMPAPKGIIAIGDCAIEGGMFSQNYANFGGIKGQIKATMTVSGCPPTPALMAEAIMSLLEASLHSQPPPAPEGPLPLSSDEENFGS